MPSTSSNFDLFNGVFGSDQGTQGPFLGQQTDFLGQGMPRLGADHYQFAPGNQSAGSGFLSSYDTYGRQTGQGWGGMALGAGQGLFNAWLGMKQYGLAKDSLAEGKRQFQLNYDAQRTATNTQLEDRQRARVASNAGAYQSVGDYMAQNGIRG